MLPRRIMQQGDPATKRKTPLRMIVEDASKGSAYHAPLATTSDPATMPVAPSAAPLTKPGVPTVAANAAATSTTSSSTSWCQDISLLDKALYIEMALRDPKILFSPQEEDFSEVLSTLVSDTNTTADNTVEYAQDNHQDVDVMSDDFFANRSSSPSLSSLSTNSCTNSCTDDEESLVDPIFMLSE